MATLLGVVLAASWAGAPVEWTGIGPGGGGAQFSPVWSPHDPNVMIVGTDMSAGFVTENGGANWRRFHLRAALRTVLFDPLDPQAIHVLMPGSLGLYRSGNRGLTWRLMYPPPASLERVGYMDDEAEPELIARSPLPPLLAIDADPGRRGVFYGTRGQAIEVSEDGGGHWRRVVDLPERPIAGARRSLVVDPRSPPGDRAVWVVGARAVHFWRAGAQRRLESSAPPGVTRIVEAAAGFSGKQARLYLLTEPPGLWVTADSGRSWEALRAGLASLAFRSRLPELRGLATAAHDPSRLYVSYRRLSTWTGWLSGVARSDDGGHVWSLVWSDSDRSPDRNVADAWLTPRFGVDWGENPLEIGVHPDRPDLVLATDFGRTMRSTNGGRSWEAVYSRRASGGPGWSSTGLDVTTSYGVHFDPFDPRHLFISYTDIGLFGSVDGGRGWLPSSAGMPDAWSRNAYWVEFDPSVRGRLWAALSTTHDLPRLKMVRRWHPESGQWHGGVCLSNDGGRSWMAAGAGSGMPDAPITHLLLDPASPRQARTLYAAAFGSGIYKSTDGGHTWARRNEGIDSGAWPLVWRLARDSRGVLYAVVARRREALEYGDPATDGALYRSTNGAESWERMPLPAGLNGPTGIAIDAGDPRRLYLSSFGRFALGSTAGAQQGGIHLSVDAGRTWRPVHSADQYLFDVTIDPRHPEVVYATGFQSSLWRSGDRGLTWLRVPGFNVKNAHRVFADPAAPGMVFVTTYGSSVWHGPGTGVPGAIEDIETPEVSYGAPAAEAARQRQPPGVTAAGGSGRVRKRP